MYNSVDTIPACDGRTDGQTSCHGIVRAMHTRHAVIKSKQNKIKLKKTKKRKKTNNNE